MKILECSSRGDTRFSPFFARINVFGKWDSIESHFQLCKRFENGRKPRTWRGGKGRNPLYIVINNCKLDRKYIYPFYKIMWLEYLDNHSELVKYASTFDDFHDMFRGKAKISQDECIRQYVKQGRESIIEDCKEFIEILNKIRR